MDDWSRSTYDAAEATSAAAALRASTDGCSAAAAKSRLRKTIEQRLAEERALAELLDGAIVASELAGYDCARVFRVARLAEVTAGALGWSTERTDALRLAALLCDVGMLAMPLSLLQRQDEFTAAERCRLVAEHTRWGAGMLEHARLASLRACAPVARFHHERFDGHGVCGLSGHEIPVEARIVSVCDALDALMHDRPWRSGVSPQMALALVAADAGRRFDPEVVAALARGVKEGLCAAGWSATENLPLPPARTQARNHRIASAGSRRLNS